MVKPRSRRIKPPTSTLEQGLIYTPSLDNDQQLQLLQEMDAAFVPTEIVVKHTVAHTFKIEFGPTITNLGKPIRHLLIGAAVLYCAAGIVRSTLQAVLKTESTK